MNTAQVQLTDPSTLQTVDELRRALDSANQRITELDTVAQGMVDSFGPVVVAFMAGRHDEVKARLGQICTKHVQVVNESETRH